MRRAHSLDVYIFSPYYAMNTGRREALMFDY